MSEATQPEFLKYAVVFVEEGVFLPKCGTRGFLVKWQDVCGVCTTEQDAKRGRMRISFAGDLMITVKEEDWLYGRRSNGIPGRAESIDDLFARLMPRDFGDASEMHADDGLPIESIPDEVLKKRFGYLARADFVNAAIDELHTAMSFVSLFQGDPRIVVDPILVIKSGQFVLDLANPTSVIRIAKAIAQEAQDPQRRLSLLRMATDDVYAYAGRIPEFGVRLAELITPAYIPRKTARDVLMRDIRKVTAAAGRFFALVDAIDEEAAAAKGER